MLYFDRQMQRLKAGFDDLNTQLSEKEVQVNDLTNFRKDIGFQFITVEKVLTERMAQMRVHNRIYE